MAENKKTQVGKRNTERAAKSQTKVLKTGKFPKEISTAQKKEQTLTMRPETKKKKS